MADDNPNLKKNGGNGTVAGNLLRGIVDIGKTISPQFKAIIDTVQTVGGFAEVEEQILREDFDENEIKFLLTQVEKDKQELIEITKRWESDMGSDSWMSKNVRPWTLVLYNVAIVVFIALNSYAPIGFDVKSMWINVLISNAGIVNTAYFGSRYLEKRDLKKYT